ncbi:MAG: DUF2589 domain-containing protein [Dehalococcoidia bacterium]|nr:DUF2589 domain-containing protein [Dehalococcoidia bacterium]
MSQPGKELSSIDFRNLIGGPLVAVVEAQAQAALSTVNFIREVGFKQPVKDTGDKAEDLPTTGEPIYVVFKYPKEVSPYSPAVPYSISVNVTTSGSGYTSPSVTFNKPTGTGTAAATATVEKDEDGKITGIVMTSLGAGYTAEKPPTVTISDPPAGGTKAVLSVNFTPPQNPVPAVFQEMKLEVPMLSIVPIPYLRVDEVTIDFNAKINSMQTYEHSRSYGVTTDTSTSAKGGFFFAKASASFKCSTAYQSNSKSTGQVERTYSLAIHVRAVQDELPGGMEKILGILEDAIKTQPSGAPKETVLTT